MAQNFTNFTPAPFRGQVNSQNVGICTPSKYPPKTVVMEINWSQYPTGCISIDLASNRGVIDSLDFIRSIVVDNTGRNVPVQVVFPDTKYDVSCPADCTVTQPIETFQLKVLIFSISNLFGLGITRIFFNNFLMDSSQQYNNTSTINFWQSSDNLINSPINQRYTAPALGSIFMQYLVDLSSVAPSPPLFGSPLLTPASMRLIITNVQCTLLAVYTDGNTALGGNVTLFSGATGIYVWNFTIPNDLSIYSGAPSIYPRTAIQESIIMSNPITIRNTGATIPRGFVQLDFQFDVLTPAA